MNKKYLVITALLMFTGSISAHTVSVYFPQAVSINDTFTADLIVNTTANVMGIKTEITFDRKKLEALSVDEGQLIKQCNQRTFGVVRPEINNPAGKIDFTDICMGNTTFNGTGTIAVLRFKAISSGTSDISLQKTYLFDTNADPIMSGVEVKGGKITINGTDGSENLSKEREPDDAGKTISEFPAGSRVEESGINATQEAGNKTINQSALNESPDEQVNASTETPHDELENKTPAVEESSKKSNTRTDYGVKPEKGYWIEPLKLLTWVIGLILILILLAIIIKKFK